MRTLIRPLVAACLLLLGAGAHAGGVVSRSDLDANARRALIELYTKSRAAQTLAGKADGILVFPNVYKAGIGLGGSYGEGALVSKGRVVDYYNIASGSVGFQLGAQKRSVVIMFMTPESYEKFRASTGWKAGVDGSVALLDLGAGKEIDTKTLQEPILGFVFSGKGLMYNLTLEGSKITRLEK